jgi:hypothetical protein
VIGWLASVTLPPFSPTGSDQPRLPIQPAATASPQANSRCRLAGFFVEQKSRLGLEKMVESNFGSGLSVKVF